VKGGRKMRKHKQFIVLLLASALIIALVPAVFAQEGKKININTAPAEELAQLKGIGAAYAERIVQFREAHGPFASPEDIMKVPGIAVRIFEANKDIITVK
jgi:competence protein ComEA